MGFNLKLTESNVYPPLPTLEEKINEQVVKVDFITSTKILNGFDYEVKGKMYHFSYKLDDQSNFSQMNTSAALSLQLGTTSEEELIRLYGAKEDGTLDKSKLPTPLPDEWLESWQGHADGTAYALMFTPTEYLALAAAAGAHNKNCLAEGWVIKAKLRAAIDEADLNKIVSDLSLDTKHRDAVDLYDSLMNKV